ASAEFSDRHFVSTMQSAKGRPAVYPIVTDEDWIVKNTNQRRKLILFDMDGTLIDIGYAHRKAVLMTVKAIYGKELRDGLAPHQYQGETQPNIMRAIGQMLGVPTETVEARLPEAMRMQAEATVAMLENDLRKAILPGVEPLLEALQDMGHLLGLVTGTISAIASVALQRTGLWRFFPLCACGEEGAERLDLLHLAIDRAARTYCWQETGNGLVVVGDAVRDIKAGMALGARVVAVATGVHRLADLAQHGPHAILPSLDDLDAALDAILARSG
ncbi:MAG: HAD hydrolase-like protein, partial [Anaerolineales bacterium]